MDPNAEALGTDTLALDTAQPAHSDPAPEPEHVKGAVREAYERAKEVAEAAGDPEKLEAIRVRRAKDGRFEPKQADDTRETPKPRPDAPQGQEKPIGDNPEPTTEDAKPKEGEQPLVMRPPVGWNAQARADFAKLPAHVQQAVAQREAEVNKGFAILAEYKGLEQFTPVIKASGLTHAQFTQNAVEWERSLKSNPIHTIMHAARIGGVDMVRLARDIVARSGGTAAAAGRALSRRLSSRNISNRSWSSACLPARKPPPSKRRTRRLKSFWPTPRTFTRRRWSMTWWRSFNLGAPRIFRLPTKWRAGRGQTFARC